MDGNRIIQWGSLGEQMAHTVDADGAQRPIEPGTVVLERYRVERWLGRGAYGEVWQALDLRNGHLRVALKFLHSRSASSEVRRRFAQECSALELLMPDPHIVAIRERGEFQGQDFMALELLQGKTLAQWLEGYSAERPPALTEALHLFAQICRGVASAHHEKSAGPIVHRDIKPTNVMLVPSPASEDSGCVAKLLDFGVARLGSPQHTVAGQLMGTPLYMAPEQAAGDEQAVSTRSDVFALGILLIEMLTLRPTGPGGVPLRVFLEKESPRSLRSYLKECRPEVPASIWDVVMQAVAWAPEARYSDAGELLGALGLPAPPPVPRLRHTIRRSKRGFLPLVIGTVVLAVLAAGGLWWMKIPDKKPLAEIPREDLGVADASARRTPAPPLPEQRASAPPDASAPVSHCADGVNNASCNVITAGPGSVVHVSGHITVGVPIKTKINQREKK